MVWCAPCTVYVQQMASVSATLGGPPSCVTFLCATPRCASTERACHMAAQRPQCSAAVAAAAVAVVVLVRSVSVMMSGWGPCARMPSACQVCFGVGTLCHSYALTLDPFPRLLLHPWNL